MASSLIITEDHVHGQNFRSTRNQTRPVRHLPVLDVLHPVHNPVGVREWARIGEAYDRNGQNGVLCGRETVGFRWTGYSVYSLTTSRVRVVTTHRLIRPRSYRPRSGRDSFDGREDGRGHHGRTGAGGQGRVNASTVRGVRTDPPSPSPVSPRVTSVVYFGRGGRGRGGRWGRIRVVYRNFYLRWSRLQRLVEMDTGGDTDTGCTTGGGSS